jgi:peptidoglycan/xylan/chitin deacetylase (PgdA/CDA1 family)
MMVQCSDCPATKGESKPDGERLPKILFLTSGLDESQARMAPGIVIAVQSLTKNGAMVRLEPRDILYKPSSLADYDIIILSTFPGYHDADRKYSLSYLSDEELHNLATFVADGGVIIAGDNVGRNYSDGTDRIIVFDTLKPDNWALADCYGISLSEKNMTGYGLTGNIPGFFEWDIPADRLSDADHELWTLVPERLESQDMNVLAYWKKEGDTSPAIIESRYGQGRAYLLASSGFLHPRNDGGFWSAGQIDSFYRYILENYKRDKGIDVTLNPWPEGYDYAFSLSLNSAGEADNYSRVFSLLDKNNVRPAIFVNGRENSEVKDIILKSGYPLASSGYAYISHTDLEYPQAAEDILRNENEWGQKFTGFRFPFTMPSNWSLLALNEQGYRYESSIGADNINFFYGSIIPHNLVVTNNKYSKGTDILEIAPTYHDDYYFLKELQEKQEPDSNRLSREIEVYAKYLENYWENAVKPYNGLMVYLGHPLYVGYNDSTLTALSRLLDLVNDGNTWMTSLDEVASFREGLARLQIFARHEDGILSIEIQAPEGLNVSNVCLSYSGKVKQASALKGRCDYVEYDGGTKLIFDGFNGQTLKVITD